MSEVPVATNDTQQLNKKVLCVFTRVLGGKSFSAELEKTLAQQSICRYDQVNYEGADYGRFPSPWYTKYSASLDAIWRIRQKFDSLGLRESDYQAIIFQSFHLVPAFSKMIANVPAILALDTTPRVASKGNLRAYHGLAVKIKMAILRALDTYLYGRVFKDIEFFLARTEVVKHSLVQDYGIDPDRIEVTYTPMDVPQEATEIAVGEKIKLIFVGNDFSRKGGPFLLSCFTEHLSDVAELTIVSKDPSIDPSQLPCGINFIPGLPREEVLELYRKHDVFVMPTWRDEGGIAICEAMANGLAVIARDVTAQKEMAISGYNGKLMDYESDENAWGEAIKSLWSDKRLLKQYGKNSHKLCKQKMSREVFNKKVTRALEASSLS